MARKKAPAKAQSQAPAPAADNKFTYIIMLAVAALIIVAIVLSVRERDDGITAWATIKSSELHTFMKECKDNGGTVDVRPNDSPNIIFVCQYPDRSVEYTLSPGK